MFWVSGMEFRGDGHLLRRGAEDVPVQRPPKLVDRRLAPPAGVVPELRAARDRRVQPGYLPPRVYRQALSGPVDPSFRALSGRLEFTTRRHKTNEYSFAIGREVSSSGCRVKGALRATRENPDAFWRDGGGWCGRARFSGRYAFHQFS